MNKNSTLRLTICFTIFISLMFSNCSPKKYFSEDENLLTKMSVSCDNKSIDVAETEEYIRQRPVRSVLGIALHSRIYNSVDPQKNLVRKANIQKELDEKNEELRIKHENKISSLKFKALSYQNKANSYFREGDSAKGYKYYYKYESFLEKSRDLRQRGFSEKTKKFCFPIFLQNIGEEPVKYSRILSEKSAEQIRLFMNNKGFYDAKVSFNEKIKNRNVNVSYNITAGEPIKINNIYYTANEDTIKKYVLLDTTNCLLKHGKNLDLDNLQAERERICNNLKNNGYYRFSKEYVTYEIDTLNKNHLADITIEIQPVELENGRIFNHRRQYISQVSVFPNHDSRKALIESDVYYNDMDTIVYNFDDRDSSKIYYIEKNGESVRPYVVNREIFIRPGNIYCQNDINNTYRHLSAFNVYKLVNIEFSPSSSRDSLNCNIYLTNNMLQAYIFEIGGTNSSGNLGAASSLTYQHKNIFHGAETFDMKLSLALESQNNLGSEQLKLHLNTQEYGLEAKLYLPRLFAFRALRDFFRDNTPRTYFSTGVNYRSRPDYTRSMVNANLNFQWQVGDYYTHTLTPLRLSSIHISNTDSTFMKWLEKLYIKDSYQDHFILGSTYSITFNNQANEKRNYDFIKLNLSWAGNLLQLGNKALKSSKNEDGFYTFPIVNTMYAQFVKADIDYRHYIKTSRTTTMAMRAYLGVGLPYGNSTSMPFTEQYFSGGANSIRAWQIRSVGPGCYSSASDAENEMQKQFPNMTSDMKIEGNLECRFKVFWVIEGAWFVDAGNIWSINADDKRTGGDFDFKRFYKEIAVGTGLGLRLDFDFFIFRTDFGLKLHDPCLPEGNRWLIKNDKRFMFKSSNWSFCLGIGYPF
ncbi:MAG: BamA/TamA family outer membrane protein [Bacteroidales bacterium]|nr:BamA/TamA family outer membrane protein [Bacteroidales bacterium]